MDERLGIFGGTFDPVHQGHLIVAERVREQLRLSRVLFIPAGNPVFKQNRIVSPAPARLEMVRLAIESNPNFEVSSVEIDRPGPTYSEDTILELRSALGSMAKFFFIMGLDLLADLPAWKNPFRLIEECQVVAVTRPGDRFDPKQLEEDLPGAAHSIMYLDVPRIEISSTDIRNRVAQGLSIKYLVPGDVEQYIREHRLYAKEGGENAGCG
ncbi:MAG: nicotinate-nucleotide adenylyltransferase [Dehalococcoidia bacterium]|nr:nicotinate-nucleotide adenylyltransferase [Dehalococcoidia bacterium]